MTTQTYYHYDEDGIADLLIGRRIVQAEMGEFDYSGRRSWHVPAQGRMVLDDGTVLYLTGNEGGCACSAGDYFLEKVATVDNAITGVSIQEPPEDDYGERSGAYRIFVFADATAINVAEFVGDDGNGYYGTGFELTVVRESE